MWAHRFSWFPGLKYVLGLSASISHSCRISHGAQGQRRRSHSTQLTRKLGVGVPSLVSPRSIVHPRLKGEMRTEGQWALFPGGVGVGGVSLCVWTWKQGCRSQILVFPSGPHLSCARNHVPATGPAVAGSGVTGRVMSSSGVTGRVVADSGVTGPAVARSGIVCLMLPSLGLGAEGHQQEAGQVSSRRPTSIPGCQNDFCWSRGQMCFETKVSRFA